MTNPLTGDFEAVLQVSGATVNRLLASMHQNDGAKPGLPTFPHAIGIRIGDPVPVHGMKGTAYAQVSVPRIDLIHGVSDRFWLEVSIRARYKADPGSVPIPEFIHGVVRAQYQIDNIDPSCRGWQKLAADYLWIRAIGDTVSFTGTAEDDFSGSLMAAAGGIDPATADLRITQLARYLMMHKFEATPHKISRRFRRGSMRSLNVGTNRSVVSVPIGLTGEPVGNIASINQDILDASDFGIGINRDVIMGQIQEQLDAIKATPLPGIEFYHRTSVDLGFLGGFDVITIKIDWSIGITSATAQWLGGSMPIPGFTFPGGLISVTIKGQARTSKPVFNWDFDITQLLMLTFDSPSESFVISVVGSADVHVHGTFASVIEPVARPNIQKQIAVSFQNAAASLAGSLSLTGRKDELITQLRTIDDQADAWFENAVFSADGVTVRGRIALGGRRAPVRAFAITAAKDGYTAFDSWIPGGRVDSLGWSWKWLNNAGDPGSETLTDRYILKRPGGTAHGRFGAVLDLHRPLPGLDGMGQVCLVVQGVQVDSVSGALVPVSTARTCKRFGFDIRLATPDRVFLREWAPGPRDPIGPVAEVAVHEVGGSLAQGHGANTLLVHIGNRWNREVAASIREALTNSTRRNAGLVVLMLFSDGGLMNAPRELLAEISELSAELEAPLVMNEDVGGSWSRALHLHSDDESSKNDVAWRLISPTGGVTWAHSGAADARELASVLDDYLFPSPAAGIAQVMSGVGVGTRVLAGALSSSVINALNDGLSDAVIEAAEKCPPPPFGRIGAGMVVTFVGRHSVASEAAMRKLTSSNAGQESDVSVTIVFDGASHDDVNQLAESLPADAIAIADPDGAIAGRFGIRTWPSTVEINGSGTVTSFEAGLPTDRTPEQGEAR